MALAADHPALESVRQANTRTAATLAELEERRRDLRYAVAGAIADGASQAQIAAILGVSKTRVQQILKDGNGE